MQTSSCTNEIQGDVGLAQGYSWKEAERGLEQRSPGLCPTLGARRKNKKFLLWGFFCFRQAGTLDVSLPRWTFGHYTGWRKVSFTFSLGSGTSSLEHLPPTTSVLQMLL